MVSAMDVGNAGTKAFGHIPVALPDGGETRVARWVVRGAGDGPVLYVHSTQHGNEISGIEVVRRVVSRLDPRRLRGTVIGVPIANPLAFGWRRHHYLQGPEEAYQERPELDIDHFWPGDPHGTHVQRLAHALWREGVRHATHVLDMHTWNRWQAAATTVRAWHAPSLELAKAFGLWVQRRPEAEGEETGDRGSITSIAIRHGKAACAPNFTGQWDIYEGEVRRGVKGLRNVLRFLAMIDGEPERWDPPLYAPQDVVEVRAPRAGIFLPRVKPEATVHRGDRLGMLVGMDDFTEEAVEAPLDGLVQRIGAISAKADVALPPMMPVATEGGVVGRILPR
jgi:predicted deacylase